MQHTSPSAIAELKSRFDLLAYAQAATGCTLSAPDAKGYRKLMGGHLGGLTVRPNGFYHHSAGVGGDALDFIAYLRYNVTCRDLPADRIKEVIREAEEVIGNLHGPRHSRPAPDRSPRSRSEGMYRSGAAPVRRRSEIVEAKAWRDITTYDYYDEQGMILFHVDRQERMVLFSDGARYREKRFLQWHRGPYGERVNGIDGIRRVLYELPAVLSAVRQKWLVVVAEGEKNADQLNDRFRHDLGLDIVATTNPGGAGKWSASYSDVLRNARVGIVGDRDPAGQRHVTVVAEHLYGIAADVRILDVNQFLDDAPPIPHTQASPAYGRIPFTQSMEGAS
jgi:hypothetical protein